MHTMSWKIESTTTEHLVQLAWTYVSGKRTLKVDDEVVDQSNAWLRSESEQVTQVDRHRIVVRTKPNRPNIFKFDITLEMDGVEIPPVQ